MLSLEEKIKKDQIYKNTNKSILDLANAIKREIPKIFIEIRKEIFTSFKLITSLSIEESFVEVYGPNSFDFKSLQNSLIFIPSSSSLIPSLSYDPSVFRFNRSEIKERNSMNQRANESNRKQKRKSDPNFYSMSGKFFDFYNNSEFDYDTERTEDESFEDLIVEFEELYPVNNERENNIQRISIEDTYERAISKAMSVFNIQYEKTIRKRILAKYKINLR